MAAGPPTASPATPVRDRLGARVFLAMAALYAVFLASSAAAL